MKQIDRPRIDKIIIAKAKTEYELKLASYIIRQEEYINYLEGNETPLRTVPFINPNCDKSNFTTCEHWNFSNGSMGCYKCGKKYKPL
jgi:hypothetical protein